MVKAAKDAPRHEQRWHSQDGQLDGPGGGEVLDSDVWQMHLAGFLHAQSLNYVYGTDFVLTEKAWDYAEAAWRADAAVAEHEPTGWEAVDFAVAKLREQMAGAKDPHDFKAVGHRCVTVLETVGREIFNPVRHLPPGTPEPSLNDFKRKAELVIDTQARGGDFSNVRKIAKAAYDQGHAIKHRTSPDAVDAGIATRRGHPARVYVAATQRSQRCGVAHTWRCRATARARPRC